MPFTATLPSLLLQSSGAVRIAENHCFHQYKVLKQIYPNIGVFIKATDIRNSFGNDITERTTGKTSHLVHYKEHFPIFFGEEKSTAHEQLTRELAQHAVPQGTKTINYIEKHKLRFLQRSSKALGLQELECKTKGTSVISTNVHLS
uniref:Uncharacterized protein n=2 Tax=Anas platyrhynchos TaxID=8839 RepID=A0A493TM89_ANAPP